MTHRFLWLAFSFLLIPNLCFAAVPETAHKVPKHRKKHIHVKKEKEDEGAVTPGADKLLKIDFPVEKFELPNGLTVLLHENHAVPLISYQTWYRVGSRDEAPGLTGVAHMLEHMMFKGAKKYTGKDFDRILHERGMVNNAFTTSDYTGFWETLPSSELPQIIDMEVDRMQNLAIRPEDLKSELQVVKEERRWRVDNRPMGLLQENLFSLMYEVHPYRWPTIGTMDDITNYTSEKLRKFYEKFYVPNNAVLVVAGDFDSAQTKKMVTDAYSVLQKKDVPPRHYEAEPEIKEARLKSVIADVQTETVIVGYPSVAQKNTEHYALDILSSILGGGNASRLNHELVFKKQIALSAGAYQYTLGDPGYFATYAMLKPGGSATSILPIMRNQISQIKEKSVTARELERAKNQVMKEFIDDIETLEKKAEALARMEIESGDYRQLFHELENYEQVSVGDIQAAAQHYLDPKREVTVILKPRGSGK